MVLSSVVCLLIGILANDHSTVCLVHQQLKHLDMEINTSKTKQMVTGALTQIVCR